MSSDAHSFRAYARRAAVALALLLALALGAEVFLRVLAGTGGSGSRGTQESAGRLISLQEKAYSIAFVEDPALGVLMAPSRTDVFETPEFTYTLQTDHAGFPNREPWPRELDIAVFGDTLVTGPGVGLEGQFTTLLSQALGGRSVLNLGVPGAGTEHQYRIYKRFVQPLEPKLVIATLWLVWDVDNTLDFNRWLAEKSSMNIRQFRESYKDTHPGSRPNRPSRFARLTAPVRDFLRQSLLLQLIYEPIRSRRESNRPIDSATLTNGETMLLSVGEGARLTRGLDRPGAPDLEDLFFRPLIQMKSEVEGRGGRFVVLLIPSKEELYAAQALPDILRTWRETKVELAARGLPTVDLYPVLGEHAQSRPPFFRVDTHLNEHGNRVVAEALANWVTEQEIFPVAPGT
jgi:hypothetical protein